MQAGNLILKRRNDILAVYFSRTGEQYTVGVIDKGNTAIVAEMITEETGADLFEVIPDDDHYPMTYSELTNVAKQETKLYLIWNKYQTFTPIAEKFLKQVKNSF